MTDDIAADRLEVRLFRKPDFSAGRVLPERSPANKAEPDFNHATGFTALNPNPPQPSPLEILCEDGPLIAVNKPVGLLTQGVPEGHPTLEGQVKQYLRERLVKPGNVYLGVPHRLDRPASGVVVFAKNSKAAARLAEQFRERTVSKMYLAVTERVPSPRSGRLTDWLLKDAVAAHVTVVTPGTANAKEAVLDYEVLAVRDGRALIEIELLTGRMHQIRVQLASRGWPVVSDQQYGATLSPEETAAYDRHSSAIALHAFRLGLYHPVRYEPLWFEAPLPAHWSHYGFGT